MFQDSINSALSACLSVGFSLLAMRSKGELLIASMYTSSRSITLAVISFVPFFTGSRSWLLAIASAMVLVQSLDALVGIKQRDAKKTVGPAAFATVNLVLLGLFIAQ